MSNNLIIKEVNFLGDNLLAIQEKSTGKIYTAINFVLRGLGFDDKQIEYQRDKWCSDKVIQKGTLKFSGTFLKAKTNKDIWCIDIKKLPLALAKINITPKMQNEMSTLAEKLEEYQDRCADELAEVFLIKSNEQKGKQIESIEVINQSANIILSTLSGAGIEMEGIHKVYLLKQLYRKADIEIPDIRVEQETMLYDKEMIAKKLSVLSTNNKPHTLAISGIIQKLDIAKENIVITSYEKHGHIGVIEQYRPVVLEQIKEWLDNNNYPTKISYTDGKNNVKSCTVSYEILKQKAIL